MKVKKPEGISKGAQGDAMVAVRRRARAVRPKSAVNEL